jgi:hypothetical protein
MKANELRIGNWVMVDPQNFPQQVCDVMCDCVNTESVQGAHYGLVDAIPLTEEWLFDFGFEKMHDGNFWNKKLCIRKDRDLFYALYEQGRIYIQHVHKLQNLYLDFTDEELIKTDKK